MVRRFATRRAARRSRRGAGRGRFLAGPHHAADPRRDVPRVRRRVDARVQLHSRGGAAAPHADVRSRRRLAVRRGQRRRVSARPDRLPDPVSRRRRCAICGVVALGSGAGLLRQAERYPARLDPYRALGEQRPSVRLVPGAAGGSRGQRVARQVVGKRRHEGIYPLAGCREVTVDTGGAEDLQWWFTQDPAATALVAASDRRGRRPARASASGPCRGRRTGATLAATRALIAARASRATRRTRLVQCLLP